MISNLNKKKVLIIDDSRTWRTILSDIFEKNEFLVQTAENGTIGYNLAFQFLPDLIITDVIMPGISGYVLCRLLRENELFSNTPIVILTGINENLDKFWAHESGASEFLSKNSDIEKNIYKFLEKNMDKISKNKKYALEGANQRIIDESDALHLVSKLMEGLLINSVIEIRFMELFKYILDFSSFNKQLFFYFNNIINLESIILYSSTQNMGTFLVNSKKKNFSNEYLKNKISTILEKPIIPSGYSFYGTVDKNSKDKINIENSYIYKNEKNSSFIVLENYEKFSKMELDKLSGLNTSFSILFMFLVNLIELRNESELDELTGLFTFKKLIRITDGLMSKAKRGKELFSLIMMDIDNFKIINDTYGHNFGNYVLKNIGSIIKENIRNYDLPFRYGGEEFLIILPSTKKEETYKVAERIRKDIEKLKLKDNVKVTVSIGITEYIEQENFQETIEESDKAMYISKKNGKNQTNYYKK
ncbi:diguanylate cyclase [Tepiditoga spiralis]|uniref:GGDEF domain-containing response regulator n=1 Tax=Tepiditoga spiralis TaxID=2108365 RepID=UPI001688ADDA|nr:diguanylate cyclase [Tepiditoga spiralis]